MFVVFDLDGTLADCEHRLHHIDRHFDRDGMKTKPDWRAFFAAEPGGRVDVIEHPERVEVCVAECPALKHLRAGGREIVREYCQHCYHLGRARAEAAGLTMRLAGGNGTCRHTFATAAAGLPPQDAGAISEVAS